ncbi:MAG: rhodanese-like domain-containing protein [Limisphaerales bacterium]
MDWPTWIIVGGAVAAFLVLKRLMLVRPAAARDWLKKGARVIDVRSEGEFQERHLPGAVNVPLDRLRDEITRHAPDKAQPLLLHCLSGTRSGIGKAVLKKMGYRNVFNLGSYGRAEKILPAPSEVRRRS